MDEMNLAGLKAELMFSAVLTLHVLVLLTIYPLWYWILRQVFE